MKRLHMVNALKPNTGAALRQITLDWLSEILGFERSQGSLNLIAPLHLGVVRGMRKLSQSQRVCLRHGMFCASVIAQRTLTLAAADARKAARR